MARGHWRRYPRRKDGSRRAGYYFVRESRTSIWHKEDRRGTVGVKEDQGGHGSEERQVDEAVVEADKQSVATPDEVMNPEQVRLDGVALEDIRAGDKVETLVSKITGSCVVRKARV
jgi:hypothetical protein